MDKKLQTLLQRQLNHELTNSQIYRAAAAYCDSQNLEGFAKFMRKQAADEVSHHDLVYDFMVDRDLNPVYESLPKPVAQYDSLVDLFETVLGVEQGTSEMLSQLHECAEECGDGLCDSWSHQLLLEQIEEERTILQYLRHLQFLDGNPVGILEINRHFLE